MNYAVTEKIINSIRPFFDVNDCHISTENKDWRGRPYKSDFVTIFEHHNIGFEVLDIEIIVFFFTDHCHFEDYSSMTENTEDYVSRAIDFFTKFFTLPIRCVKVIKGEKIKREEYFFVLPNGQEESIAGVTVNLFAGNLFAQKKMTRETWQYDKTARDFIKVI